MVNWSSSRFLPWTTEGQTSQDLNKEMLMCRCLDLSLFDAGRVKVIRRLNVLCVR